MYQPQVVLFYRKDGKMNIFSNWVIQVEEAPEPVPLWEEEEWETMEPLVVVHGSSEPVPPMKELGEAASGAVLEPALARGWAEQRMEPGPPLPKQVEGGCTQQAAPLR